MNKYLKLTLELPKSVNHIYGRNKFGSVYLKGEGKDYKKQMIKLIQEEVNKQHWDKLENTFIYLDEVVFMNKKGRDADNLKKLTQDCITESNCVWTDDTYCWARTQRVFIDKDNPRIELVLSQAPDIGIFNNKEDYNKFINTYCNNCTNGNKIGKKGGCSIYRKALENRIQENLKINFNTGEKQCLNFKQK
ncbi:TPA: RusA family crossover junction endodeoxyribonuclease [Clostridium botulinum]|nr:RusA family crossover junction endodeoxyribonuclease [Clostridium botulinum]HDK7206272.1 RusA family crossover junction endodeoxyribonuclease [Clostridium botulinum]HDK7210008.1 RusA family crossover junction endodeoxyribonuclease [Clostridium botulinum]HDK7265457.1 RusA family crossover junction endodeoxyribonuclease [Clostridium botulinum]HDK7269305.1 RusA family crossover junction endodeoxyribonuclease [Clostridium botulinum]